MRCLRIKFSERDSEYAACVPQSDGTVIDSNAPAEALFACKCLAAIDGSKMLWVDNAGVGIAHAQDA